MRTRVLYVVSRFPKVTETFVANEWTALTPRFDMYFAALIHTGEPALHPATRTVLRRTWFVPRATPGSFRAHATWIRRAPRRYVAVLRDVVRGARGVSAAELVKSFVTFHQAVGLALLATDADVDHVHAHFANHPATAAWVVHRLTGVPFSFTAHANDLFRKPVLLERKVDAAQFVVAISDYNRRILECRCPGAAIHVVHCGVDTKRFSVVPRANDRAGTRRHVLCVAGFETKKGHADLVAAFATVARKFSDVDLVLIGDGPERDNVAQQARAAGIGPRVAFLGTRSTDDVRTALALADVFVLPSVRDETGRMDGIPVALMEAMAAGVPVVSTSVSGIPELVAEGAGIVVAPGDRDAIAEAMTRLLEDHDLASRLALQARARVERYFDLFREAAKLGDLFATSVQPRG